LHIDSNSLKIEPIFHHFYPQMGVQLGF